MARELLRRARRRADAWRWHSSVIHRLEPAGWPSRSQRDVIPWTGERSALAIERHASFAPTAPRAAWRTRTCEAAQPATAQPRDRRPPVSAATHRRPHLPSRPDPRCRHRCTAAEHQHPRSPGNARRSRSRQAKPAHHRGPRLRARSAAVPNAPTAEAPRTRPATRPGRPLRAPAPRPQPLAPRCDHDRRPRPPSARHNRRRRRVRACARSRLPHSSRTASSLRSQCSPGLTGDAAASRSQYKLRASVRQLANARPGAFPPGLV